MSKRSVTVAVNHVGTIHLDEHVWNRIATSVSNWLYGLGFRSSRFEFVIDGTHQSRSVGVSFQKSEDDGVRITTRPRGGDARFVGVLTASNVHDQRLLRRISCRALQDTGLERRHKQPATHTSVRPREKPFPNQFCDDGERVIGLLAFLEERQGWTLFNGKIGEPAIIRLVRTHTGASEDDAKRIISLLTARSYLKLVDNVVPVYQVAGSEAQTVA
ncbi:MAG: hypothetical protein WDZ79_01485 [Candidatus Paceibacterota bacterium]